MVIVLEKNISDRDKKELKRFLEKNNFHVNEIDGEEASILGAVGHLSIDPREVEILPGVDSVIPISKPYKMASREFKKDNTVVEIPNKRGQIIRIGGMRLASIAGPCAVESREQMMDVAKAVSQAGAVMLRGGAYKPRTSPYSFQGMGEEGVKILKQAGDAYGLPVVTEIVSSDAIPVMKKYGVDCLQIGARNMQNFELLKKVGAMGIPVILKRGLSATIQEWLMAAEYLLSSGTDNVILCERGIRTYEKATRNTLDLSAIPIVKELTHLPVIVDPSHAVGIRAKVAPMGLAAVASGADGLIVEVHCNPDEALSDGAQSLYPSQFEKLMRDIDVLAPVVGKETCRIRVSKISAEYQKESESSKKRLVSCAYSGSKGAYAEQAVMHYFDNDVNAQSFSTFRDVFRAVNAGEVDCGMIPIENSLAGSVFENYDNLLRFEDISISGSLKLRIEHSLLASDGCELSSIKTVYSHPQGFAQCSSFLSKYPEWEQVECRSTTDAAKMVAMRSSKDCAAIASIQACAASQDRKKLIVLKTGIENDPRNYTRFLLITPSGSSEKIKAVAEQNGGMKVASFAFVSNNKSGALYECLGVFASEGLNLTRLESRPVQGQPWRYMFYADIELTKDKKAMSDEAIENVLKRTKEALSKTATEVHVLGVYTEIN